MILPLARVLTGFAAVLAMMLGLEWLLPGQPPPGSAVPLARLHAGGRPVALPSRATTAWAETILARPVFSISRRPPPKSARRPEQGPGQARLAGIMITRSGRRAIFAPEGGGRPLVLAVGGSVDQSTIRDILPDRVLLAGGEVLRPSYDRNKPASTTPPFTPQFPSFPNAPGSFGSPIFNPSNFRPAFQPQVIQPPAPSGANDEASPPIPPPNFRGTLIPQRRP